MIFALIFVIFSFFTSLLVSLPTVVVWMSVMPLAHVQ